MSTPPPAAEYEKEIRALYRERNERTFGPAAKPERSGRRWLDFFALLVLIAVFSVAASIGVYGWLLSYGTQSSNGGTPHSTVAQPELADDYVKQLAGSSAMVFSSRTVRPGVSIIEQSYLVTEALGQALVLSSDGWLVTTQLVAPKPVGDYVIVPADGRAYPVTAVILDPVAPLTYLKISARGLTATPFALWDDMMVNDAVVIIASESQGTTRSWYLRYLSNINARASLTTRPELLVASESLPDRFILDQTLPTSARGAPVVNLQGKVVGLVADWGGTMRGVVPLLNMIPVMDKVFSEQKARRPALAATYVQSNWLLTPEAQGAIGAVLLPAVRRAAVVAGGPAEKAGLKEGDKIVALDNERLNALSLSLALQRYHPGVVLEITIERGGQEQKLPVTLGEVSGEVWLATD